MRYLILVWIALLLANHVARAETNPPSLTTAATVAPSAAPVDSSSGENVPVPVPAPLEKAVRHSQTGTRLWCVRRAWELALPAIILFSGFSARLRDFARRLGWRWYFALCLYFVLLT